MTEQEVWTEAHTEARAMKTQGEDSCGQAKRRNLEQILPHVSQKEPIPPTP